MAKGFGKKKKDNITPIGSVKKVTLNPKKRKKRQMSDVEANDRQIMKETIKKVVFIGFWVVIFVVLIGVFGTWLSNRHYSSYKIVAQYDNTITSNSQAVRLNNSVVVYNNDGIKCINSKGDVVWNETYQMQNPMIEIDDNILGLADYNGSTLYMFNEEGLIAKVSTDKPIRNVAVSRRQCAAVIVDNSLQTQIYVYDFTKEQNDWLAASFSTTMANSGYPIDIAISPTGYLVEVSYLFVGGTQFSTSVAFYNFGAVGQNSTDNLVSEYSYADAVVPELKFLSSSKACAVADNRLMFYGGDQYPESKMDVMINEEIKAVYFGESHVAVVFNNTDTDVEARYKINIYDAGGSLKDTIYYADNFTDIFFDGKRVVVYGPDKCLIRSIGSMDKFEGGFDNSIITMVPTNIANRFILVSSDSMRVVELE